MVPGSCLRRHAGCAHSRHSCRRGWQRCGRFLGGPRVSPDARRARHLEGLPSPVALDAAQRPRRHRYKDHHFMLDILGNQKPQFDDEELQILRDFERGEFESVRAFRDEKLKLEEAARNTLQKDKRINIRISSRDLGKIQARAAKEGMPYQTYIASTLHKVVAGRLK